MERRLKQCEQLSECKPSSDFPSDVELKTIESKVKLHGMASDNTSLNTSKSLDTYLETHLHEYRSQAYRGLHTWPTRRPPTLPKTSLNLKKKSFQNRVTEEVGEDIAIEDNGNHSDGGIDDNVEEYDVYIGRVFLNKRKIYVYRGHELWPKKATEVSRNAHNGSKHRIREHLIAVDLETIKRFRKVITDSISDSIIIHVFIRNDSSVSKPGDESDDCQSERKDPVICVDSQTYKQIRDVLAMDLSGFNSHMVIIKTDSKWSKSLKQLGCKFCWCFPWKRGKC